MTTAECIAIIGMAGKFPKARTIEQFWQNLVNGEESITFLSDEELRDIELDYDEVKDDPAYVRARGILEDIDQFDAPFFGLPPAQARALDPQQRLWLETAWEALERAGYAPSKYDGKIGVFAGEYINGYLYYNLMPDRDTIERLVRFRSVDAFLNILSNDKDYLPSRTAYLFDLKGPAINIQTACSSSLVAVAQACQNLLHYESDICLAGGVCISVPQQKGYFYQEGGMVSADGHCRPFSASATGTVFSSGVGVVVLKRLDDALADGDNIMAVIRGTALNNDGAHKASYTAPSINGQAEVIATAHALAGIDPATISYVEAHGTATPVGDPIEVAALTKAFRLKTDAKTFCGIGSVKSNLGHLDAASGVTGLIKTVLSLQHQQIPATLHYDRPNPEIDFANTPFYVVDRLTEWKRNGVPRRAGVSSFGVGGTNVHVVLEEAPDRPNSSPSRAYQLLTISAKTPTALATLIEKSADYLAENGDLNWADVAYTCAIGRTDHPYRHTIVAPDTKTAAELLRQSPPKVRPTSQSTPPIVFLFPGQGSQYLTMGHELYESEPTFRQAVDQCAEILRPILDADIRELIFADENSDNQARLENTGFAQPAIFTIEYALAQLWQEWGVEPTLMIGHSVGEFTAACLAGLFSLEGALTILAGRARLMQALPGGAMRAVRLSAEAISPYLGNGIALAAQNAPNICVVSGDYAAIERFEQTMTEAGYETITLHTSHAFHSEMMEPMLEPFRAIVESVERNTPRLPMISTVTGGEISAESDYWVRQLRQPVLFSEAITEAIRRYPNAIFLECGPSKNLTGATIQHLPSEKQHLVIDSLGHPKKRKNSIDAMLTAFGRLWQVGAKIVWERYYQHESRHRLQLPTYPFEHQRYWVEPPARPIHSSKPRTESSTAGEKLVQPAPVVEETPKVMPMNRRKRILAKLQTVLTELSGIEINSAEYDTPFIELGYDSLTLTQLSTVFKKEFGITLKFRKLLEDVSTLNLLTDYFAQHLSADQFADPAPVEQPIAQPAPTAVASSHSTTAAVNGNEVYPQQLPAMPPMPANPMMGNQMFGNPMLAQMMQQQLLMMQMWQQQMSMMYGFNPMGMGMPMPAISPTPATPPTPAPAAAVESDPIRPKAPAYAKQQEVSAKRFGPYKQIEKGKDGALTPTQQTHLNQLIERMLAKTGRSRQVAQENRTVQADPRTVAGFRTLWKELVYQIVTERSKGSKMWDIDGNEYVDITMGFGVGFLGHSPDFVTKAVQEQLERGLEIGPQMRLAGEVARLVHKITGMDRVSFCNTGSEAVLAALRLARTVTGRDKIVYFYGDYHGIFDEVLARPQIVKGELHTLPAAPGISAAAVENAYILEYGDPASLQFIRDHAHELAAVLIEPVQSRHPENRPSEFLREIRRITTQSGTAMIFDEVITGFRLGLNGAQGYYQLQPDICAYGKIIGGGIPIGVVAGKAQFMNAIDGGWWQYGDDSVPEAELTFFAGTFVRHPMAMASAKAVLEFLIAQGDQLQQRVADKVTAFAQEINAFFEERQLPIRINHFSSWFRFDVPKEMTYIDLFYYHLLEKGVYVFTAHQNCFFSIAHTDDDIARIKQAIKQSAIELQTGGFFPPPPASVRDPMPLSSAQKEIWLATQMNGNASLPYNESFSIRLQGTLHPASLQSAVQAVIQRHGLLNVVFSPEGDWQKPREQTELEIPYYNWSSMDSAEQERKVAKLLSDGMTTPFDLVKGPLVRVNLIRLAEKEHLLHWTAHHIIFDGWSSTIVIDEMRALYNAKVEGKQAKLPTPDSYRDFLMWEANGEENPQILNYWKEQFKTPPTPLNLPLDRPRPTVKTYRGSAYHFDFDPELIAHARKAAGGQKSSLFLLLLTAYEILLHRLSDQTDFVVGVPIAGQSSAELLNLVGHGVNVLPLRVDLDQDLPFSTLLRRVSDSFFNAQEQQPCSLGRILQNVVLPRDAGRAPLVEVMFNLDRKVPPAPFAQLETEIREVAKEWLNWELFLNLYEEDNTVKAHFEYNTDLYDEATIHQWLLHYQAILQSIADNPETPIGGLNLMSAEQRQQQLIEWNNTTQPHRSNELIHRLIAEQAARTPDRPAWVFEGEAYNYRQLDQRANQLGHALQTLGVTTESRVGIFMERNLDMGVAVLGVLKAGGAYVPLAPDYPADRVEFILQDSDAAVLITEEKFREALATIDKPKLFIDSDWSQIAEQPTSEPSCSAESDNLAYIIYTSGSTGRPKGAMLPHRAISNFSQWYNRHYQLTAEDAMILKAPFGFDASVWEIFTSLTNGGRVVVCKQEGVIDTDYLIDLIRREKVTTAFFVPTHLRVLLENPRFANCTDLKVICCGGEAFPEDLRVKFNRVLPTVRLDNFYGPTETCIGMLTWNSAENRPNTSITPIGFPTDNMQAYVLNSAMQLAPIGAVGELYIGGVQLARGYWNRPKLTDERFVPNPFAETANASPKLYKSGDYVRWGKDGAIEYIGRIDHQVKIRGLRIELGEIEASVLAHPKIDQAVVVVRQEEGNGKEKQIVAYIVPNDPKGVTSADLRAHLKQFVPDYMVPNAFVMLNALPTSPNGKVDRAKLPAPDCDVNVETKQSDIPRTPLEFMLVQTWEEVLKIRPIGIHDNFFELGGHSLLALRLFAKIQLETGKQLPLSTLTQAPTIAELATLLEDTGWKPTWASLVPIQPRGSKRPFFHVAAYMESVLEFNYLGRHLDPQRPFYGIQPQGLDGIRPIHQTIPEMAASYISEIKTLQPYGPYILGGHCAGAWVAYEMAMQLQEAGDEIALLIVVDSLPPHIIPPKTNPVTYTLNRLAYYVQEKRLLAAVKWQYEIRFESKIAYQFGSEQAKQIEAMRATHNKAYEEYQITPHYTGPIALFRSSEYAHVPQLKWHEEWRELTSHPITVDVIHSTHATLLHAQNASKLASAIWRRIDLAEYEVTRQTQTMKKLGGQNATVNGRYSAEPIARRSSNYRS